MCLCASLPVFTSHCCWGWPSELSASFRQLDPSDVPAHHLSPWGISTGPNSSCHWCPSTLGIVQPPSPAVVAHQIHFTTILHFAVPQLQSLHSAIHTCLSATCSTLTYRDMTVHILLSAGLICCFPFFSNPLSPSGIPAALTSKALRVGTLVGTVALYYNMIVLSLGEASTILSLMMQSAVYYI